MYNIHTPTTNIKKKLCRSWAEEIGFATSMIKQNGQKHACQFIGVEFMLENVEIKRITQTQKKEYAYLFILLHEM